MDYFLQGQDAILGAVMRNPGADTYLVFAPSDSLDLMKTEGREMVGSGAGDKLFAVTDPPTARPFNCLVLDV